MTGPAHILSNMLMCAECGSRLHGYGSNVRWACSCCGGVSRSTPLVWGTVDAYVRAQLAQVAWSDAADAVKVVEAALGARVTTLEAQAADLRSRYLAPAGRRDHMDGRDYWPALRDLREIITTREREIARIVSAATAELPPDVSALEVWEGDAPETLDVRRMLLAAVIHVVVIHKVGRGKRAGPDSIEIIPAA